MRSPGRSGLSWETVRKRFRLRVRSRVPYEDGEEGETAESAENAEIKNDLLGEEEEGKWSKETSRIRF